MAHSPFHLYYLSKYGRMNEVASTGDDDQIVPIGAAALRSSKLVKNATLKIYAGAPHGLAYTHKDQLNADLLAFLKT